MRKQQLPKLSYGEGSMSYMPDGNTIIYKKSIKGHRLSAYGKTVKEAKQNMKDKEEEYLRRQKLSQSYDTLLKDGITHWFETYRSTNLKASSYDALEKTIKNQILEYDDIALLTVDAITPEDIQKHMKTLQEKKYSYSTIKKAYEALNAYFNFVYARDPANNPMILLKKPTRESIEQEVPTKEIEFYNDEQIRDFIAEATRIRKYSGNPAHRLGWALVFLLYSGVRINEGRFIRWRDLDLKNHKAKVRGQFSRVINRDIPPDMDGKRVYKTIESTTKTRSGNRDVYLVKQAENALEELKKVQSPTSDDEFIFASSRTGLPVIETGINESLKNIQRNIGFNETGLHVLRHTACSLFLRAGADKGKVAEMLGQGSTEMIEKVYRHITEEEKFAIIKNISNFGELNL